VGVVRIRVVGALFTDWKNQKSKEPKTKKENGRKEIGGARTYYGVFL